jgi:hypothetical protein
MFRRGVFTFLSVLLLAGRAGAVDPADRCEADKLKEVGKYCSCRLKAESKAVKKAEEPDFSRCNQKYTAKWASAEAKAGGACPTEGDAEAVQDQVIGFSSAMGPALAGERFIDNGDGTICDTQTKLMWEKKVEGYGCLHCLNDEHTWTDAMSEWISEVNGWTSDPNSQAGLGDYSDWRIPNIVELQTIVDLSAPGCGSGPPCVDPVIGPTVSGLYWSSTSIPASPPPPNVWTVTFFNGAVNDTDPKDSLRAVRAVRSCP